MSNKESINKDYVKSYCASYTNNILDTAFKESPFLTGNDLKKLCSPEQINYNLLKAIFLQWEAEVTRMQNPYFDHDAPSVKHALRTYMQVLSRHIKLDKGSLRPLLQEAVEETIYQIFSPSYFFEYFLWPRELGPVTSDELNKLKRFIKINQGFLSEIIGQLQKEHTSEIEYSKFLNKLKSLCFEWDTKWESTEEYALSFSKVVALNLKSLYGKQPEPQPEQNAERPASINQKFAKEIRSLNDSLQTDQKTLVDKLNEEADQVANIRESLNINQKFRLINELYNGDAEAFNSTIDQIDKCDSYQQALTKIDQNWDMENEAVKEFMNLLGRRFSEPGPAFDERPSSIG
jgi:hypothetical protein